MEKGLPSLRTTRRRLPSPSPARRVPTEPTAPTGRGETRVLCGRRNHSVCLPRADRSRTAQITDADIKARGSQWK